MIVKIVIRTAVAVAFVLAGYAVGRTSAVPTAAALQAATRVFELRTYTTPDDAKFGMLQARFRDHTTRIFEKHGIKNVGYWTPVDTPNTLIYIVSHPSMEEAKKNWGSFRNDPDWLKVRKDTEAQGLTGVKVESKYLVPTDYSPLK